MITNNLYSAKKIFRLTPDDPKKVMFGYAVRGVMSKADQIRLFGYAQSGYQVFLIPYEKGADYSGGLNYENLPNESTIKEVGRALKRLSEGLLFYSPELKSEIKLTDPPLTNPVKSSTVRAVQN